jgi:hypothetical protein
METTTINNKKRTAWLLGALLVSLIAVWWQWQPDEPVPQPVAAEPLTKLPGPVAGKPVEAGTSEIISVAENEADDLSETTALEQYMDATRYPATTRRLSEESHDLLNPGARHEKRRALPGDKNNPDLEWEVLYTADRFFVRGGEPLLISLQLWDKGEAVLPTRVSMLAEAIDASGGSKSVSLVVQTDGAAKTAVFTPNDHWPEYAGQVRVSSDFSADGLDPRQGSLDFYFTGTQRVPAKFTGRITDRPIDGDLLFEIGVDVKTGGMYRIDGNLFDHRGVPFGWARFEGTLVAGQAVIALRYVGLLFHDAQAQGPYTLKSVHGYRLRPGDTPHREDMPELANDYVTTGNYRLAAFNSEVNDSPRRQRMIRMYEDAERRGLKLTTPEYTGDG